MKIGIAGYGKMGKTIEAMAVSKGHEIVWIKDKSSTWAEIENIKAVDVAIEFSTPESAVENLLFLFSQKIPVVCGTTGWLDHWETVEDSCTVHNGTFIYASNFSIGVNILFEINKVLANLSNLMDNAEITLNEIHHIHKKDKPSGTALTLINDLIEFNSFYKNWHLVSELEQPRSIAVNSVREGEVFGIHEVVLQTETDKISIRHEAFNRNGFVSGVLMAADWIQGKRGIYRMADLINDLKTRNT
jgi:4-hydroxy-tetrahydrodipicolinate reductase